MSAAMLCQWRHDAMCGNSKDFPFSVKTSRANLFRLFTGKHWANQHDEDLKFEAESTSFA